MANSFIALPVPAGDGVGAWVDTSALGVTKTLSVDGGPFSGTLFIESSNDATASSAPVNCGSFAAGTASPVDVVAAVQFMRVRRTASTGGPLGTPSVKVGAESVTGQVFGAMAVPAGDGVGAGIDLSAGGPLQTINIAGPFSGQVVIEFSTDTGVTWSPALLFGLPSVTTPAGGTSANFAGVVSQARVRRQGTVGGPAPRVSVGSGSDVSASSGPSGPSAADTFDITLSYGLGNQFEQQLPDAARSFWLSPRSTGDTADANQVREWVNDQALSFVGLEVVAYSSVVPVAGLRLILTIGGSDSALTLTVPNGLAAATILEASSLLSVAAGTSLGVRVDGSALAPGMSVRLTARVHGAATGTPSIPSVLPINPKALFPPENLAVDGSSWIDAVAGHLYNLTVPADGPPPFGVDPISGPARILDASFNGHAYGYFRHYAGGDFGHPTYTPCMLATSTPMFAPSAAPIPARTFVAVVEAESSIGGIVASSQFTTPCFKGALNLPVGDLQQAAYFTNFQPALVQSDNVVPTVNLAGQEVVLIWRTNGSTLDFFINGVKQTLDTNVIGSDNAAGPGFCIGNLASSKPIGKNGWQGKICFVGTWARNFTDTEVLSATANLSALYVTP